MVNLSDNIDRSLVAVWCSYTSCSRFGERRKGKKKDTNLLTLLELLTADSASLLLALALLEEGLGDEDLVLSGNGAVKVSTVHPQVMKKNFAECKNCSYSATFSKLKANGVKETRRNQFNR